MSLSKQLLILISALFLMVFGINFAVSVNNIKTYLEGESKNHAQDTATSLGLSLSPYMVNETDPTIKTMMSAIFDMGYYQEIRLTNVDNKSLVTLSNDPHVEGVPQWFMDWLPMTTATAESEISSGWNITGVVYVSINPGYAYSKLYEQAKTGFYYSLATFVFSIALLIMALRVTLASLKRIDHLALAVADGHFETIDDMPWTTEVRNVAASMNIMSTKIEGTIKGLNAKLDSMGDSLLHDDLTGLFKKAVFETDMKHLFMDDVAGAFAVFIKIDGLVNMVKSQSSDVIDQFLKEFAGMLEHCAEKHGDNQIRAYRFYGAEFALLISKASQEQVEVLVKTLSGEFAELGEKYQQADLAHIGVAPINPVGTIDSMIEAATEAYQQAQIIGANSYFIRIGDNFARDISQWKELVFDCVDNEGYALSYVGQINSFQSGRLIMEEAFTEVHDKHGERVSIGPFISIAEKFAKIVDLDKGVIDKVIAHIRGQSITHAIAINLSTRTIKNSDFRSWLEQRIRQNQDIASQLVFSLSAYAVSKEVDVYREFIDAAHKLGTKVVIKRFETQSMSPAITKKLKPDFIRLAREIGNGVDGSRQKQDFVQAMQEMGALLDIVILAENVQSEFDYQKLKAIGITGASR